MENYLFLDIDGVLNTKHSFNFLLDYLSQKITEEEMNKEVKIMPLNFETELLNSDHVYLPFLNKLKNFIVRNNVKVIGISSWFSQYETEEVSNFMGFDIVGKIDSTLGCGIVRTEGLKKYFKDHNKDINKVNYVIFDDCPEGYNTPHFLHIKNNIDDNVIRQAEQILKLNN